MESRTIIDPPFEVELRDYGLKTFESWEEVRGFAINERETWQRKLNTNEVQRSVTWNSINPVFQILGSLVTIAEGGIAQNSPDATEIQRSQATSVFKQFNNSGYFITDSPTGRAIIASAEHSPLKAAAEFAFEQGMAVKVKRGDGSGEESLMPIVEGIVSTMLRRRGLSDSAHAEQEALQALRQDWGIKFQEIFQDISNRDESITTNIKLLEASLNKNKENARDFFDDNKRNINGFIQSSEGRVRSFLETEETRFNALDDAYNEQLKLRIPASYWNVKGKSHNRTATISLVAFVAAAATLILISIHFATPIFDFLKTTDGEVSLGAVALVAPIAGVAIWFLRMISRIYVTNVDQAVDAGQRKTMIQTFLALVKDEKSGITSADRLLILQAMFRPTQTSPDDDAPPANLLEIMERLAPKKTK